MNTFFRIFLIFLMFFLFSCEKEKLVRDDEALNDDVIENDENMSDDDQIFACADEWEKTELIEDVSTMFDFDIKVETGKWNWEKKEEFDELVFEGDPSRVLGVLNDGSLILSDYYNTLEGYSILAVLHPDGTTKRYILEIDKGKKITFGIGTIDAYKPFVFWPGYYFDKDRQEILISVTMMTKLESPYSDEYSARPFVIKIDSTGGLSYISWENDGTSICSDLTQTDDKIVLFCSHWIPDPEIYMKEGMINAEINVINGNTVYRKMMKSEYIALTKNIAGSKNGEIYSFYEESTFNETETTDAGFIYSFDEKDLCLKTEGPENYFDELAFDGSPYEGYNMMYPFSFLKKGEYSIVGGVRTKLEHLDYEQIQSFNPSLYVDHSDNDTIFSFGIKDPRFEVGEVSGNHPVAEPAIFSKENSNLLFVSLISTFDMEDEGQDWLTPELLEKTDFLYRPSIAAVDIEKKEVYIRNFFMGDLVGFFGEAFSFEEYIYFVVNYGQERTLYRMPETWLINENARAKESRFFIEDIAKLREAVLKELKPFETVSSGKKHTCAVDEEKRVICWGDNSENQLGNQIGLKRSYPDLIFMDGILKDKTVEIMKTGSAHACVVADDKRIYCWGSNDNGKLGKGGGIESFYPVSVKYDGALKDKKIADVAPGTVHTCAIDVAGKAYCWGRNTLGSVGTETDLQFVYEPVSVDMTGVLKDRKIIEISSGSAHTCAVADDGGVYCWGSNGRGQLGDGNGGNEGSFTELGDYSLLPVKTENSAGKYLKVSAGYDHTCILNDKGKIFCFGNNANGQLGDGTTEMRLTPVALNSDKVFKSVSAGSEHTCAVDDKDEAYCWGGNIVGQLGTGDKESSLIPVKVKYATETKIKSISCGHRHTCSVTTEGVVHCWGLNSDGQIGNGTYEDSLLPKEIQTKE